MRRLNIHLFLLLIFFNSSYASSQQDNITCDEKLMFNGEIYSSAKVNLIKLLDENLGLFKIKNLSDIDLEITIIGKQNEHYRYSMFWGYLYIDLLEQEKGWLKTGVYDENVHEPINIQAVDKFDYLKEIIIAPKESIEFITIAWPKGLMNQSIGKTAIRLYMQLRDKEGDYNLVISDPYCF